MLENLNPFKRKAEATPEEQQAAPALDTSGGLSGIEVKNVGDSKVGKQEDVDPNVAAAEASIIEEPSVKPLDVAPSATKLPEQVPYKPAEKTEIPESVVPTESPAMTPLPPLEKAAIPTKEPEVVAEVTNNLPEDEAKPLPKGTHIPDWAEGEKTKAPQESLPPVSVSPEVVHLDSFRKQAQGKAGASPSGGIPLNERVEEAKVTSEISDETAADIMKDTIGAIGLGNDEKIADEVKEKPATTVEVPSIAKEEPAKKETPIPEGVTPIVEAKIAELSSKQKELKDAVVRATAPRNSSGTSSDLNKAA